MYVRATSRIFDMKEVHRETDSKFPINICIETGEAGTLQLNFA